jgi:hypothetical protein
MAQEIPAAQLAPLQPAKHMGFIEHHEEVGELVRQFASACVNEVLDRHAVDH